jgi:hypothetical protein
MIPGREARDYRQKVTNGGPEMTNKPFDDDKY